MIRPTDPTGDSVLDQLAFLEVDYEVMPCDPALAETAAFCAAYGVAPEDSANAILVAGKAEPRSYAVCLLLATCRLDVNGTVRKRLGARKASFAGFDETEEITGMTVGGVTPFGLPGVLPVWIDAAVMERQTVVVGGGSRDRKLRLAPGGLLAIPGAEVVNGLARPIPTD
ncbi:MAG: YbaK/EbsC family protein [Actinomycetota bacterium]|nr:YbaK/EbsC family protein [Actinomycetota bacterium]